MKAVFSVPVTIVTYLLIDIIGRPILGYFFTRDTVEDVQLKAVGSGSDTSIIDVAVQLGIIPCIIAGVSVYLGSKMLEKKRLLYSVIMGILVSLFTIMYSMTYMVDIMISNNGPISQIWLVIIVLAPILGVSYIIYGYKTQGNNFDPFG